MPVKMIAAAILATVLAGPALAMADATYWVRNGSETRLMCALRLERGQAFVRFTLAPGRVFGDRREGFGRVRVLTCSSSIYRRASFNLRAGLRYEVIEAESGQIRLRTIGPL